MSAPEASSDVSAAMDDITKNAAANTVPAEQPSGEKLRRMSVSQQNENLLAQQREQFKASVERRQ